MQAIQILESITKAVKTHGLFKCQQGNLKDLLEDYNILYGEYQSSITSIEQKDEINNTVTRNRPIIGKRIIQEFNEIPNMPF